MSSYAKSNNGLVHFINHAGGGEHTLCGDAHDIEAGLPDAEAEGLGWVGVKRGPVTCPDCAAAIRQCRGVRIAKGV